MKAPTARFGAALTAAAAVAAAGILAACGGGGGEAGNAGDAYACPVGPHPGQVLYGTPPPGFVGPLQAAPASVSAAAGRPLFVCP